MKFTLDFEITQELEEKFGKDLRKQAHANFSVAFFEQIKDKLNYSCIKMKTTKQKVAIEDSKIKNVDVNVYRFSIDMPFIRNNNKEFLVKKRKPKHVFKKKGSGEYKERGV